MQKLIKIFSPTDSDLLSITNDYLLKGWNVKSMVSFDKSVIFLLEKDTRKDKLERLDEISEK